MVEAWGPREAFCRFGRRVALLAGILAVCGRAHAAPADTTGPAYHTDTDGDGTVDALDTCPTGVGSGTQRSTDPACYLGSRSAAAMSWIDATYKQSAPTSNGAFWRTNNCTPSLAFPVDDMSSDGQGFRGVVLVGTGDLDSTTTGPPGCLVSIDYGNLPGVAISNARSLVDFYDSWLPHFVSPQGYAPDAGLGLIRGSGIETIATRIPERPNVQRLRFTRGVLYGVDLHAFDRQCVGNTCVTTTGVGADWSILPTGLDAALISVRDTVHAALNQPTTKDFPDAIDNAIEGVPKGLRLDDRYPKADATTIQHKIDAIQPEYTLSTNGRLYTPLHYDGHDDAADPWLIVPAVLGGLGLDFLTRPTGQVQYSTERSSHDTLLAFQTFGLPNAYGQLPVAAVTRNVEAIWPSDKPAAATSESNGLFGDRWTSNAGPKDCWSSDDDPNSVTYAFSAGDPSSAKIAESWCPSTQHDFWNGNIATNSQDGANDACRGFQAEVSDYKNGWDALGRGIDAIPCVLTEELVRAPAGAADCGACGADTILSAFCAFSCDPVCDNCCSDCKTEIPTSPVGELDAKLTNCVLPQFMSDAASIIGERWDAHWKYLGGDPGGRQPLVPVVGMVRSEAFEVPKVWPSVESHITHEGDMMSGHSHQLTDWNWGLNDFAAFDPMYMQLAKRKMADGGWTGMEVELEFGVPYGDWNDGARAADTFDLHGLPASAYLAPGGPSFDFLGQVWANNSCDRLGIDWGGLVTSAPDFPTPTCGGREWRATFTDPKTGQQIPDEPTLWREHFGRGLFVPMPIPSELISNGLPFQHNDPPETGMLMASSEPWPNTGETSATALTFDDWQTFPRRIGFLGQPIVDCGHNPYRVEIHPPHVITMEAFNRRSRALDANGVSIDGAQHDRSVEAMAFGWVSVASPSHLEFDLWPTPRPSGSAKLVVTGHDLDRSSQVEMGDFGNALAIGRAAFLSEYGYVIDAQAPQHGSVLPTLACTPLPVDFPNHVHCEYDDPAGNTPANAAETPDYGNPRMTPHYATSRFDLRINMEWK